MTNYDWLTPSRIPLFNSKLVILNLKRLVLFIINFLIKVTKVDANILKKKQEF